MQVEHDIEFCNIQLQFRFGGTMPHTTSNPLDLPNPHNPSQHPNPTNPLDASNPQSLRTVVFPRI